MPGLATSPTSAEADAEEHSKAQDLQRVVARQCVKRGRRNNFKNKSACAAALEPVDVVCVHALRFCIQGRRVQIHSVSRTNLRAVDYTVMDARLRERESLLSADMGLDTREEIERPFLEFQAAGGHVFSDPEKGVTGRHDIHRQRPGRKLAAFCRARRSNPCMRQVCPAYCRARSESVR